MEQQPEMTDAEAGAECWRNKSMLSAYWKGHACGLAGGKRSENPYIDAKQPGFRKGFRNAWGTGHHYGERERAEKNA